MIGLIGGSMWVSMIAQKREAPFEMGERVAHRMGRSGSRSGNVVERAQLFERAAAKQGETLGLPVARRRCGLRADINCLQVTGDRWRKCG